MIELPVQDGWNILDDNILATSDDHFRAVMEMLRRQKQPAVFSGGLEPEYITPWKSVYFNRLEIEAFKSPGRPGREGVKLWLNLSRCTRSP